MIRKSLQEQINAAFTDRVAKARKILRADQIMIVDKETKEEREATEHEQLELVRKIFGQAYTAMQKIIVEQFENGQLGKKSRRKPAAAQVTETAEQMNPENVVTEMSSDDAPTDENDYQNGHEPENADEMVAVGADNSSDDYDPNTEE